MNASAEMDKEKGHGILATAFWMTAPGLIIIASAARKGLGCLAVVVPGFATINLFLLALQNHNWKNTISENMALFDFPLEGGRCNPYYPA
jgi:hypothetical protein